MWQATSSRAPRTNGTDCSDDSSGLGVRRSSETVGEATGRPVVPPPDEWEPVLAVLSYWQQEPGELPDGIVRLLAALVRLTRAGTSAHRASRNSRSLTS
jgi:hypothetical protein